MQIPWKLLLLKMKKLLFIPRAIIDILSIWNKPLTIKEKSSLTYTLSILKLKKWLKKPDAVISYTLFGYKLKGCNQESLQFLIKEIFIDRIYELDEEFKKSHALNIIDIGSNTGLSVLFFKKYFGNAVVDAYEPNESSFELLKQNMEQNKFSNVHLFNAAIGSKDGVLYPEEGFSPCSVNQKFSVKENFNKPVKCFRLTNLLQKGEIDCVKIDIEGNETDVLTDIINNNSLTRVRCWLVEFHNDNEQTNWIKKEFLKQGFVCRRKKELYCFKQKE
jgi:FkbM family methyltransferase